MTETRKHLHHYRDGVCADSRAPGGPCGERQVYRPPTGQRAEYADVLVSKDDLRFLIESYRGHAAMDCAVTDALCERLELMLD